MIGARITLEGDFRRWRTEVTRELAERSTKAMHAATDVWKAEVRKAIQAAGLGRRLSMALGSVVYPRSGSSLEPAGILFARGAAADRVLRAYTEGARIRGRGRATGSQWLAIPIKQNLPVLGRAVKPTPDLVSQRLFGRSDALRFVIPRGAAGRFGLLVADAVTRGKTGKRVTGYGRNRSIGQRRSGKAESLAMFILVREVNVRRRVDVEAVTNRVVDQLPRLFASAAK